MAPFAVMVILELFRHCKVMEGWAYLSILLAETRVSATQFDRGQRDRLW